VSRLFNCDCFTEHLAINLTYLCVAYLKTQGVDPREHPVKDELVSDMTAGPDICLRA
jgi:hypothetical protein